MAGETAKRDENYVPVLLGTNILSETPAWVGVDATTHRLLTSTTITANTAGIATEATLAKTVGFDANSDITTSIVTVGSVKTITQTDGVKTCTTTIDATDVNDKLITKEWT